MSTVKHPETTTSFLTKWERSTLLTGAGAVGGYIGQEVGRGWAIRVGSNLIYDYIFAKTSEASYPVIGVLTAHLSANGAVGIANPWLSNGGAIVGGALGLFVSVRGAALAMKVGALVLNKIFYCGELDGDDEPESECSLDSTTEAEVSKATTIDLTEDSITKGPPEESTTKSSPEESSSDEEMEPGLVVVATTPTLLTPVVADPFSLPSDEGEGPPPLQQEKANPM